MGENPRLFYEFGPFRVDETERRLTREGAEVVLSENGKDERLSPKTFDLLLALLKYEGRMVRREELIEHLWPGTFVEDNRLSDNISILRKFLGDTSKNSKFIETVPKYGYRFVAEARQVSDEMVAVVDQRKTRILIEESEDTGPVPLAQGNALSLSSPSPPKIQSRLPWIILIAVVLITGVSISAVTWFRRGAPVASPPAIKSIAVLPFKPLVPASGDPALELGMTDALINKLANIRQITVRPTSSVMKYASSTQDLRAAGEELKVDVLVDGKVQRDGDRIRLSVQLVRASDGVPIWAEQFDEEFKDIFTVQDSVSERVAAALALRLTGEEKKGLAKRYTDNAEAYQLYLKGLYHWQTFSRDGLLKSLNFYNAAIERDPKYALAYAGLANTYNVITIYGPLSVSESMEKSRAAALRAVELDETLAEAHVALGAVKIMHEWDWPGAERELKRAIALDPKAAGGHNLYGYYLQAMGRQNEAVEEMKKATEAAPQWFIVMQDRLESTFGARRYDEAIALSVEALRLEPDDPFALWVLGRCYMMTGRHDEAVPLFERGLKVVESEGPESATRVWLLSGLGYAYARAGRRVEAQKVVVRMRASESRWKNLYVAMVLAGLGERDQAFAMLDEAYRERAPFLWQVKFLPEYDALRSDPRYAALLRSMNLAA